MIIKAVSHTIENMQGALRNSVLSDDQKLLDEGSIMGWPE